MTKTAQNKAQQFVEFNASVRQDPKFAGHADWTMIAVGFGGTLDAAYKGSRLYTFADGSAAYIMDGERAVETVA